MTAAEAEQRVFLETLFGDLGGFIDVREISADGTTERRTFSSVGAVAKILSNGGIKGRNVYIGVATRTSNSTAPGAGGKSQLHTTRALWVDFDYKQEGDAEVLAVALESFP